MYWQVLLAQAVYFGPGQGCLYSLHCGDTQHFTTRKAFAIELATSGSSLGGVIYAVVFSKLHPRIGFGWATRVLDFISLATCLVHISVMRVRQMQKQRYSLQLESGAFEELPIPSSVSACPSAI